MASGSIVIEQCPACKEIVWEDEWTIIGDTIIHERCRRQFIRDMTGMSEAQFVRLSGASEIRKDIEGLKQNMNATLEYYLQRIQQLEQELNEIEKRNRG